MNPLSVRDPRRGKVQTGHSQSVHLRARVRVGWLFRVVLSRLSKTMV